MNKNGMKLDAKEQTLFKRQVEYVKATTYDAPLKPLKGLQIVPISEEAPSASSDITIRKYTGAGVAKIIADYAKDFPRVDNVGEEISVKVRDVGASYGYNIKEIRQAQIANLPLDAKKGKWARQSIRSTISDIALNGDSNYNIQGLIYYPNKTEYSVPQDSGSNGTAWSYKTNDEILADLYGLVKTVVKATNDRVIPDTLVLPTSQYYKVANTKMGNGSPKTILRFFLDNNEEIKNVYHLADLEGAGASGGDRFMCYPKDPDVFTLEIPTQFEQFDPEREGMEYTIACHAETAGIIAVWPTAICFGDGI